MLFVEVELLNASKSNQLLITCLTQIEKVVDSVQALKSDAIKGIINIHE
jgi:hypothetical protein